LIKVQTANPTLNNQYKTTNIATLQRLVTLLILRSPKFVLILIEQKNLIKLFS